MANIANNRQVILPAQRNDDWPMEETPMVNPLPPGRPADEFARIQRMGNLKELELADAERRLKEAEATVAGLKDKFEADKKAWENRKAAELEKIKAAGAK